MTTVNARGIAAELASTAADIASDIRLTGDACPASLQYARDLLDVLDLDRPVPFTLTPKAESSLAGQAGAVPAPRGPLTLVDTAAARARAQAAPGGCDDPWELISGARDDVLALAREVDRLRSLLNAGAVDDPGRATLWQHVACLVDWLDDANPRTDHEIACRVMKLTEETGEAVSAYLGWTGQNPRKGKCATLDDLTAELCDVIVTALIALATVTGPTAYGAEARLQAHVSARFARLIARITTDRGQDPDGWACITCGFGWFGTRPDDDRCPDCRDAA